MAMSNHVHENDVGKSLLFDKVLCDDMLVAAQGMLCLKNSIPRVKFEESSNLTEILSC